LYYKFSILVIGRDLQIFCCTTMNCMIKEDRFTNELEELN
jgi:hypothetical protein